MKINNICNYNTKMIIPADINKFNNKNAKNRDYIPVFGDVVYKSAPKHQLISDEFSHG